MIEGITFLASYLKTLKIITDNYEETAKALHEKFHHGLSEPITDKNFLKILVDACIVDNKIEVSNLDKVTKFLIYKKALSTKLQTPKKMETRALANRSAGSICSMNFPKIHQIYALKEVRPDINLSEFEAGLNLENTREVLKFGIITRFERDHPIFQHSTIVHFYVAEFIIDGFKNPQENVETCFKLLLEFLHDPQNFYVVNMFISGGLKDHNFSEEESKILAQTFENLIETGKFEKIFVTSILENYKSLYEFLLKLFAKVSDEVKVKQLERELKFQPKDVEFKSANEFFISRTENFEKINKTIIDEINDESIKEKLFEMLQKFMEDMRRNSIIGKELQKIVDQLGSKPK